MKRGDIVQNGLWFGSVLALHGDFVWVEPKARLDPEDDRPLLTDGPLTFRRSDLSYFNPTAAVETHSVGMEPQSGGMHKNTNPKESL